MKKSTKIIASLATVGALCVGTVAMAAPWHHGAPAGDQPQPPAGYSAQDFRAAGWEAMARILTLKPEQQAAWKAYVDARSALDVMPDSVKFDKPAVDIQTKLERRAQVAKVRADLLDKVAKARADLGKVLSPEQKYVLESFELQHSGHGMRGPRGGDDRGPQGFGPHHRGMGPQGFGPGCQGNGPQGPQGFERGPRASGPQGFGPG
ncbi:Spy/CpxP family protein refolding chaperone, partial [Sutterella sp.]|uniref:Spy/CpxP family protein refolding chaperone n=1 Tax=Sutterella sp. TaxID=1981025 RepID=UPI0026E00FC3